MGVQEVAAEVRRFRRAVERVTDDGVSDAREVDSDLMGATGADADLKEGELVPSAENAPGAPGGAAFVKSRGHANATDGVAGDGAVDAPGLRGELAMHEGEVHLLDLPVGKLGGEGLM